MTVRRLALAVLAVFLAVEVAPAGARTADEAAVQRALVEHHAVPRLRDFAGATSRLDDVVAKFCAAPDAGGLNDLRAAFVAASDAWQGVQHLRFGPTELFMRAMRVEFWPDPRDSVGSDIGKALAAETSLDRGSIAEASVAIQGLPAMERLLWAEGAPDTLLAADAEATRRCEILVAIAANLDGIAADTLAAWVEGPDAFGEALLQPGPDAPFPDRAEITRRLFMSLYNAIEVVADHKLALPLGDAIDGTRPRLAEAWPSGRSMAAVIANLEAAREMYAGPGDAPGLAALLDTASEHAELDALFRRAFDQTLATARSIDTPLSQAVADANARPRVEKLRLEASALKALLARDLAPALGVTIGFNALDGD